MDGRGAGGGAGETGEGGSDVEEWERGRGGARGSTRTLGGGIQTVGCCRLVRGRSGLWGAPSGSRGSG